MREIKFRAWDKKSKTMWQVAAIDWDSAGNIVSTHLRRENFGKVKIKKYYPNHEVGDDIVFLQYTGLKDMKGNEIYEGDILHHTRHATYGVMGWSNQCICFRGKPTKNRIQQEYFYQQMDSKSLHIIGNTYENPELLGETK